MTKLELFVERAVFDEVKDALAAWASTFVWSEVNLHLDEGRRSVYRGLEYEVDAAPMMKIEAYVPTRSMGRVVDAIGRIVPSATLRLRVFAVVPVEDLAGQTAMPTGGSERGAVL